MLGKLPNYSKSSSSVSIAKSFSPGFRIIMLAINILRLMGDLPPGGADAGFYFLDMHPPHPTAFCFTLFLFTVVVQQPPPIDDISIYIYVFSKRNSNYILTNWNHMYQIQTF